MTNYTSPSNTILEPPWRNLARVVWILLSATALLAFLASIWISLHEPLPSCITPTSLCGPWQVSQEDMLLAAQLGQPAGLLQVIYIAQRLNLLVFFVVGVIIFWRKSEDWVALLLSLMLTLWTVEGIQNLGVWMPLVNVLYIIVNSIFAVFALIFPNGRFVPRWTVWVALVTILAWVPLALPNLLAVFGVPSTDAVLGIYLIVVGLSWFFAGGYAAIYRYLRVSTPVERQQTKWVLLGLFGAVIVLVPFILVSALYPPSKPSPARLAVMYFVYLPVGSLAYLCVPLGIAFAILRYRLWDIDVIIRRTLTYAILSAFLVLIYFGSIVALQRVFTLLTNNTQNEIVTVVSTLAIAALFIPLRNRIQQWIDRRFNRKKYNAQKVLTEFAETLRDETNLEQLTGKLVQVINETMQPKSVSVWLAETGAKAK